MNNHCPHCNKPLVHKLDKDDICPFCHKFINEKYVLNHYLAILLLLLLFTLISIVVDLIIFL